MTQAFWHIAFLNTADKISRTWGSPFHSGSCGWQAVSQSEVKASSQGWKSLWFFWLMVIVNVAIPKPQNKYHSVKLIVRTCQECSVRHYLPLEIPPEISTIGTTGLNWTRAYTELYLNPSYPDPIAILFHLFVWNTEAKYMPILVTVLWENKLGWL